MIDKIKSLIKSHYEEDFEGFTNTSLEIVSKESKIDNKEFVKEVMSIIDNSKISKKTKPVVKEEKNFIGLIERNVPPVNLYDLICKPEIVSQLERIKSEFIQRDKLGRHNLNYRRKILISGPNGTGKTFTTYIIANKLKLPLYNILFMDELNTYLIKVFDFIKKNRGVYVFNEIDSVILNSILYFIEKDDSDSIIIVTTKYSSTHDFDVFDDFITYSLPNYEEKTKLIKNCLSQYKIDFHQVYNEFKKYSLTHRQIYLLCMETIKETVLKNIEMSSDLIIKNLIDRYDRYRES